ncbi:MAG: hypothetical protein ACRBB6_04490 [Neptuniibacter sp.]
MDKRDPKKWSKFEPDYELIRILYEEENMPVKQLADKFDGSIHGMWSFIYRNGFKRNLHPALQDLKKTSLNKLLTGEAEVNETLHVMRKFDQNKVIMEESEYIRLWEATQ